MHNKRLIAIFCTLLVMIVALSSRIYYISYIKGKALDEKAQAQRHASVEIEHNRGLFFDRNFVPIAGDSVTKKIKLESEISYLSKKRYTNKNFAQHILGYLDEEGKRGVAGLERHYDDVLSGESGLFVEYERDINARLIPNQQVVFYKKGPDFFNVQLTLDSRIQKIVEKELDRELKGNKAFKGAVVVQECDSGEILAMASRPVFNRNKLSKALDDEDEPFLNRATSAYNLGSIFKIVDIIARVEEKGECEEVDCKGQAIVGDRRIACSKTHGKINEKTAFGMSCNSFFVENAQKIGAENLIYYAKKMGLGAKTGVYTEGISEMRGNVPFESQIYNSGDIANLSLGQGYVTATPIQVCNMINAIANGGKITSPKILRGYLYPTTFQQKQEESVEVFSRQNLGISEKTVEFLQEYMKECVENGTGTKAKPEVGGAAGKTGSAEAAGGKVHAWFAGYFPLEEPKYSICVFVEDGKSGGEAAAPIFKRIADKINVLSKYEYADIVNKSP